MTRRRLTLWCALAALLLAMLHATPALAAQPTRVVHVEITVGIKHGGTAVMEPLDGAPAPRAYQLKVADGEVGHFQIDFTQVGEYTYGISQIVGDKNLTYDTTPYTVKVYVTDNDGRLGAAVNVYDDTNGAKVDSRSQDEIWAKEACEVYFVNRAQPSDEPDDPDNPDNPSDEGGGTPSGGGTSGGGGKPTSGSGTKSGSNSSRSSKVSKPQTGDSGSVERYFVQAMLAAFGLLTLSLVYLRSTLKLVKDTASAVSGRRDARAAKAYPHDGAERAAGSPDSREG